jgi:hypothetical protein
VDYSEVNRPYYYFEDKRVGVAVKCNSRAKQKKSLESKAPAILTKVRRRYDSRKLKGLRERTTQALFAFLADSTRQFQTDRGSIHQKGQQQSPRVLRTGSQGAQNEKSPEKISGL